MSSSSYRNQAKRFLRNEFPRISCAAIDAVLQKADFNFTNAFHSLSVIEAQRAVQVARGHTSGQGAFPDLITSRSIKVFIKSNRPKEKGLQLTDEQLANEISAIPSLITKGRDAHIDLTNENDAAAEEINDDDPKAECLCCYGEHPQSAMRECQAGSGHLVCGQCIYHYVSEQLDGNGKCEFSCIVDADCQHSYPTKLLDDTLTPRLNRRVNDKRFREEMKKAGVPTW